MIWGGLHTGRLSSASQSFSASRRKNKTQSFLGRACTGPKILLGQQVSPEGARSGRNPTFEMNFKRNMEVPNGNNIY